MVATSNIRRPEWQEAYCRVCGRASEAPSRGDCPGCSGIFALQPGRCLYSPATGRLWFKARGRGRLVNPTHTPIRRSHARSDGFSRQAPRVSWLALLIAAAAILYRFFRMLCSGR
jgi:hypothetical protein